MLVTNEIIIYLLAVIDVKNDGNYFGNKLENGSYNGAIGNIQTFKTDIAFVGFFIKDYEAKDIDFTASAYQDQLCIITKKAGRVPSALLPMLIFERKLWASIFVTYLITSFFWCIIRLLNLKFRDCKAVNLPSHLARASKAINVFQIFIDTSILILNSPFRRFPKVQSERILISSIFLFSLIVIAAYQSSLATVYTQPMYYKNIQSLEELDESGMKIVSKYKGFLDDAFPPNASALTDRLLKKVLWMENVLLIIRLQTHREAGFTRKSLFDITYKSKNFHLIPECPRKYRLAYTVPKGFAFLEALNVNILRTVAGGIVSKLIENVKFKAHMSYYIQNRDIFTPSIRVFTIYDLQMGFYVLAAGLASAFVIFTFEAIIKRFSRRSSK